MNMVELDINMLQTVFPCSMKDPDYYEFTDVYIDDITLNVSPHTHQHQLQLPVLSDDHSCDDVVIIRNARNI